MKPTPYSDWLCEQLHDELTKRGLVVDPESCTREFLIATLERNDEFMGSRRWHADRGEIILVWCVEDVLGLRPYLSEAEAMQVLETVRRNHDAENGVTWDTLRDTAESVFPPDDFTEDDWMRRWHEAVQRGVPEGCIYLSVEHCDVCGGEQTFVDVDLHTGCLNCWANRRGWRT